MKKLLLSLTGMLLLLSGCRRDEILTGGTEPTVLRISAQLMTQPDKTRAYGDASKINRFILQIYHNGSPYGTRFVEQVAAGTTSVNFDVRLVNSQTYDFVFWADCSGAAGADNHYNTSDLSQISLMGDYAGNDDTYDAFYAKETITVSGAFTKPIQLKRPFGQLNVKASDLASLPSEFKPDAVSISFKDVYTVFNALTGGVSGPQSLTYTAPAAIPADNSGLLSMDYLLVPAGVDQTLVDFAMTFYKNGSAGTPNDRFKSIPLKRNFRTNVSGNLFTTQGSFAVTVKPEFEQGDLDKAITEVATTDAVTDALKNGSDNVVLTTPPAAPATIELPQTYTEPDKQITITLPATTQPITIAYAADASNNPPAALTISAPQTENLIINTPQSSITLNGNTYGTVEATTAPNTLIVGSDVSIEALDIKQGNVEIYGVVNAITTAEGYTGSIIRVVSSTQDLANAAADNVTGYTSIQVENTIGKIDGRGATFAKPFVVKGNAELSNLKIDSPTGNGISIVADGVFVVLDNVTVMQNEADVNGAKNCAILAGGCNNLNLVVKNSHLIISKSNQRGINIHSATDPASVCTVTLDNTHIGPTISVIGGGDYTSEQNNIFKSMSDSRGISIAAHAGKTVVNVRNNSVIEGVFYVINAVQFESDYEVNVDNSCLDGRAAFNLWPAGNGVVNVTNNSKLIGRNPFGGSTEIFATIVICEQSGAWAGAANNVVTVKDSEIYCYNNPETDTNIQYAVQLRSPRKNVLNLLGTTKIYDKSTSTRLPYAVQVQNWINEVHVDPTVVFYGNDQATIVSPRD